MPNHLLHETSPYLLQHKDNPVDWYPWGPEALDRARRKRRPIFLSIGYAACHWCHVMERESFENEQIARLLNDAFVCIKVDREERPDLDQIYMNALHVYLQMIGSPQGGGWPLSMFLTPELEPICGGTYWPPEAKHGRPGFADVLQQVARIWREDPDQAARQARQVTEYLQVAATPAAAAGGPDEALLGQAAVALDRMFDDRHGGFGQAPKFPPATLLQLLLRLWRRAGGAGRSAASATAGSPTPTAGDSVAPARLLEMVCRSLDRMAAGGIYDHLGGGFARYSVDPQWLVPHFEKMLYDNALLAAAYLDGYLATGAERYARVVRETLDYVLRDMTDPAGGFYSAEDADSEGEEGRFYVWTPDELTTVLGSEAAATFARVYGVTETGNFEGRNILHLPRPIDQTAAILAREPRALAAELAVSRGKLLAVRQDRVRPAWDDKVLVNWNGLMIDTMARAAGALNEPRYLDAAVRAVDFLLAHLRRSDGRLLHTWRNGIAKLDAYLDDYASLMNALVSVYEVTFQEMMIDQAVWLADVLLEHFRDPAGGGFFYTADDHETLIARHKDMIDSGAPSGNALAATALLRLGKLCGRPDYVDAAAETIHAAASIVEKMPAAVGQMLLALDMDAGPTPEIVLLGDPVDPDVDAVLDDLRRRYLPNKVVAYRPAVDGDRELGSALDPIFAGKHAATAEPTALVCENFACQAPVVGKDLIVALWERLAGAVAPGAKSAESGKQDRSAT